MYSAACITRRVLSTFNVTITITIITVQNNIIMNIRIMLYYYLLHLDYLNVHEYSIHTIKFTLREFFQYFNKYSGIRSGDESNKSKSAQPFLSV